MQQNYCHHINSAGMLCRGIPLKKHKYCYWHLHEAGRRMKAARARARRERVLLQLPVLDDLHAVQVSIMRLGEALNHGEVDQPTARLLLALLRLAASNIKARDIWEQEVEMQGRDKRRYMITAPGFEEQYGLAEDFDLSVDPEVAFPPPEEDVPQVRDLPVGANLGDDWRDRLGQILRDAATAPAPGTDFQATADGMEVLDVFQREGEQASKQRAAQLKRNHKRREGRERRMHYDEMARNYAIQRAAQNMFVEWQRKAEAARGEAIEGHAETDANRKPPQPEGPMAQATEVGAGVA